MRTFFLKSAILVTVGYLAWMVTSAVVAQQAKKPAPRPVDTKKVVRNAEGTRIVVGSPTGWRELDNGGIFSGFGPMGSEPPWLAAHIAAHAAQPMQTSYTSADISRIDVTVNDGVATVSAVASLIDRRVGVKFLWHLRVTSTDRKTLARQVYAHQVFNVPRGEQVAPTFQDTIAVPPGKSLVELTLYAFGEGTDMNVFNDEKAAEGYKSARAWRKVNN